MHGESAPVQGQAGPWGKAARLSPLFQATLKVVRVFRLQVGAKLADKNSA